MSEPANLVMIGLVVLVVLALGQLALAWPVDLAIAAAAGLAIGGLGRLITKYQWLE